MSFKYRVSVIIPIYNSEKYLEWCVNSVLHDQGPLEDYEVVLVNDGSSDSSPAICDKFAAEYPNVKVIHKQNEKLSATRNRGMRESEGKYFCFLDSDDALLPGTINQVADFFDQHYDEVDLVTYPQIDILRDGTLQRHFRYDLLKEPGVYDLTINPYITQTRVNVFSKNKGNDKNVYFDTTPNFRHEDSCYNTYVLMDKMKIGYCDKGGYIYALNNDNITANYFYAYYIFETAIKYYEQLFDEYKGRHIPRYVQAVVLNDLNWKFKANKLYPYHYGEEELKIAKERVRKLIEKMDLQVLLEMPRIDSFHRHHFLKMKLRDNYEVICDSHNIGVFSEDQLVASWYRPVINLQKFEIENGKVRVFGAVKHLVCTYENVELWIMENDDPETLYKAETADSTYSYNLAKVKVTDFRRFIEEFDLNTVKSISFLVKVQDYFYPTFINFTSNVAIFPGYDKMDFVKNNCKVTIDERKTVRFEMMTEESLKQYRKEEGILYKQIVDMLKTEQKETIQKKKKEESVINNLKESTNLFVNIKTAEIKKVLGQEDYDEYLKTRNKYLKMPSANCNIWLYNDANTNIENGLLQFRNDLAMDDGVERYYIYDNEYDKVKHHFKENEIPRLVKFGSKEHRDLFMQASVILTAYGQRNYYCPFKGKEIMFVQDLWKYKVVYLQHGILHATLPWQYGNDRLALDKIVISSEFERKNMVEKYCFIEEELIDAGMVRFDYIDRSIQPKNRILIAPSWRYYLIGDIRDNRWTPQEEKFMKSEYYQEFSNLFANEDFLQMLEDNDLYLDFKLHPIFECYAHLFTVNSDRVNLAPSAVNLEDYKICITDFSSFVFDFVYCGKPVLYFMPDYDKFVSGMHTYRELDIPLKEGFGKLSITADQLVSDIQEIINNDYKVPAQYQGFTETFFTQYKDHAKGTYEALKKCYIDK